ncbi:uncharacterized protein LOC124440592 [Xenia sp. Carnegie-2017]|uniref:uncharacterized protein LOC124440592 n=1 Tax=Xenia sp. Carnegie-2017 TaxID=2897299 RepID=UPI001F04E04D|nr:uncharacterized protein LOC124440592 [Xenia sp. Carnegie-2017]XP_046846960.1 uncharacterized protein LOC124440592 [Xenia sp. Carnegie-2017]XP_046846967.1 uncharacterized protein LOC124440592 [Xenia sp. Carnegie-2017]XP_046846975.1 uncharacterized protein LOC124440592 [Xenia sp. Carnegie-2017]
MAPCLSKSIMRDVYCTTLQKRTERSPFARTDMYDIVSWLHMSNELVEKEIMKSEGENALSFILSHLDDQSMTVLLGTYIKKFFKCTIFTNDAFPLFPYNEDCQNHWFTQNFSRRNDAGHQTNQEVKIFNASNKDEAIRGIIEVERLEKDEDGNTELYFHGTDHSSAQNILENGIELSKGREKCDLSHNYGFYMANDYEYSLTQYSYIKTEAALLIFCLCPNNLKGFRELYLCDKRNKQDFSTVTQYFRAGKIDCKGSMSDKLFSELEKCNFIKSPITSDGRSAGDQREDIRQVCVKKHKMAETMSGSPFLVGAVFIKPDSNKISSRRRKKAAK